MTLTVPARLAGPVLLVGLLLAGCASTARLPSAAPTTPTAAPASPPPTTRVIEANIPRGLRVTAPRDARGIAVCDLLTEAQLTELGLVPGSDEGGGTRGGPTCSWRIDTELIDFAGLTVRVDSPNSPLAGTYRLRDTFAVFEPLPDIAGHPAARTEPVGGGCVLTVGIADDQGMNTSSSTGRVTGPGDCDRAIRMAELVLSNLPPMR